MEKTIRKFNKKMKVVNALYLVLYALCMVSYIVFRNDLVIILLTWVINAVAAIGNWCWYIYCKRQIKRFQDIQIQHWKNIYGIV